VLAIDISAQLKNAHNRDFFVADKLKQNSNFVAKANEGIETWTGLDVVINCAQVTLVKGDLRGIAQAKVISEQAIINMKKNHSIDFVYNLLDVPLAAGLLYPFTGWLLSLMIAALAMSLNSVSVITYALRLR